MSPPQVRRHAGEGGFVLSTYHVYLSEQMEEFHHKLAQLSGIHIEDVMSLVLQIYSNKHNAEHLAIEIDQERFPLD